MTTNPDPTSSYLQDIPAIFSEEPLLGRFLLAFEQVLTGVKGSQTIPQKGLEEIIASISKLFAPLEMSDIVSDIAQLSAPNPGETFNPSEMEKEFLQWLAGWVALSLRADWTPDQQRQFLANIVSLYRYRGTKDNLAKLLEIYTNGLQPIITEPQDTPFQIRNILTLGTKTQIPFEINEFQIHEPLTVGVNTQIGGAVPHYFHVKVKIPKLKLADLDRQREIISALIDLQKPAHTYYDLELQLADTVQVGVETGNSYIGSYEGKEMVLGSIPTDAK